MRRMQHIGLVGCESAKCDIHVLLMARGFDARLLHVPLAVTLVLLSSYHCYPMDVQAKERLLAVYWGHQDQQCLAALV